MFLPGQKPYEPSRIAMKYLLLSGDAITDGLWNEKVFFGFLSMNESGWTSNGNGVLALAFNFGSFFLVGKSSAQPCGRGGGVDVMLELLGEYSDASEVCVELC